MNQHIGILAAVLCMSVGGGAIACDDRRGTGAAADNPVLERALQELRAEQQWQVQARARQMLAQMRSQAATAVAQGASTAAELSINARP
jgi:hypothetical protein